MPTYFVDYDLAADLLKSTPPADMLLSDLVWPFKALTFILPEKIQMEYFGCRVPFVSLAHRPCGEVSTPKIILDSHHRVQNLQFHSTTPDAEDSVCIATAVVMDAVGKKYDYASNWKFSNKVEAILGDFKFSDETGELGGGSPADKILSRKVVNFGILMLMAIMAMPEDIEPETCIRKAKVKHGTVKSELWSPRYLGRKYGAKQKACHGGTHASPRAHPRQSHWRHVRFGKGKLQKYLRLFPWQMVGVKEDE
jgi:hypothetical protein